MLPPKITVRTLKLNVSESSLRALKLHFQFHSQIGYCAKGALWPLRVIDHGISGGKLRAKQTVGIGNTRTTTISMPLKLSLLWTECFKQNTVALNCYRQQQQTLQTGIQYRYSIQKDGTGG